MNGEHKTGAGTTGGNDPTPEELEAQARARQDPANHPRMQAMAALAQKHEQAIEDQLAAEGLSSRTVAGEQPVNDTRTQGQGDDGQPVQTQRTEPVTPPATQPTVKTPGVDVQHLVAQFGDEPVAAEALDNLKVRFKVAGEDRIVSLHDLRREAQLDGAAGKRLEEANRLIQQAQQMVAQAGTKQPPVGVEDKSASGDSSATSKDATAIAKELVQALFVGDEDAAVATMLKVLAVPQNSGQTLDTNAIAARVVPAVRQQLSQEEAEAQFRSDFKEIVADPRLVNVADTYFAEVMAEDPQKSYAEALSEAGNRTNQWVERVTGKKPATETTGSSTRQEKLAAKQRIDEVRGLGRTDTKQEPAVETPSQVIQKMREARGLA